MSPRRHPGTDPRELPIYSIADGAHYLRLSTSTLKSWVTGRLGATGKHLPPIIRTPGSGYPKLLSFFNIVEAHIVSAIRRVHGVPMQKVRRAIHRVELEMGSRHPLIDARFQTDGIDLFMEKFGKLVNQDGQLAIREAIEASLSRVDWDKKDRGLAARLYPFTQTTADPNEPRVVVIDPRLAFGRPVLVGTGIPTAAIAARARAGEPLRVLAEDYGIDMANVEDAIRCELRVA